MHEDFKAKQSMARQRRTGARVARKVKYRQAAQSNEMERNPHIHEAHKRRTTHSNATNSKALKVHPNVEATTTRTHTHTHTNTHTSNRNANAISKAKTSATMNATETKANTTTKATAKQVQATQRKATQEKKGRETQQSKANEDRTITCTRLR